MARILVVDDSPFLRKVICNNLSTELHEVVAEAEDGDDAIEKYRQSLPDVVTMDVTMPNRDGLDATRAILDEYPDAKIIMVSAISHSSQVMNIINSGAKDFVAKPFKRKQLLASIERAVKT
jgi:two-component system, chemotaxis family, chemotaxis protein CheY